jgi:DNA repair protein SbcC/Rad50
MKILAIRGRNLASLAGDFEIDFTSPPLARAGIFAVVGPTGAGKSTILDAMCLALFDRVPRLGDRGGARIGESDMPEKERLSANDVRHLLRKGTGTGFAEVDFEGRDGRRYRSHWEVRRARSKASGRFQLQDMKLTDLDTKTALGGTKTETLTEIQDRLGLSFDQFRRSALLAQGDFSAFLRAGTDERAELLERMTGTEIYGLLSKAAHERAAAAGQRLDLLEAEHGRVQILDADARKGLEDRAAIAAASLASAKARLAEIQAAQQWYRTLRALCAEETAAASDADRAVGESEAAAGLREDVARTEKAQHLRGAVERANGAVSAAAAADVALAAADTTAREAAEKEKQANENADTLRALLEAAAMRRQEAEPVLRAAGDLDRQIAEKATDLEAAAAKASSAEQAAAVAIKAKDEIERAVAQAKLERTQARAWLERQPGLVAIATEWPRWRSEIDRFENAAVKAREHEERLKALETARRDAVARIAALDGECHQLNAAMQQADAEWKKATAEADAEPLETAMAIRDAACAEQTTLQGLCGLGDQILACDGAVKEAAVLAENALKHAEAAEQEATAQAEKKKNAARLRAECDGNLSRVRLAAGFEEHRARLKPGEPCPLCGSADHPFASAQAAPSAEEARLVTEAARLLTEVDQATAREAAAQADARNHTAAAIKAGKEADECRTRLTKRLGEWDQLRPAYANAPNNPLAPHALDDLTGRLAAIKAGLEGLDARVKNAQRLSQAERVLRDRRDEATKAHDERQAERRRVKDGSLAQDVELGRAQDAASEAEQRTNEALEHLRPAFAWSTGWQVEIARAPGEFRDLWDGRAKECCTIQEQEKDAASRIQQAAEPRATARAAAQTLQADATARAEERSAIETKLVALKNRRSQMLEGRAANEVQTSLDQTVAAAQAASDEANRVFADARVAAATTAQAAAAAAQDNVATKDELSASKRALDERLAAEGVDEATLRIILARDGAWLDENRLALKRLDDDVVRTKTVLDAKRRQREDHERSAVPPIGEPEIEDASRSAAAVVADSESSVGELAIQIRSDDNARLNAADLLRQLEDEQQRSAVWEQLRALIGSADGKKFRVFAQSLTLDLLLQAANDRLAELMPRYRLARVPNTDLDLQVVDQDLALAARSVNSLSGGETFLVSLGLALGLSSLAGRDTRIESLFIDEGFGSLDVDMLEKALAVLDALQASGCKVGIISHVPGLAERIGVQVRVVPQGAGRSVVRVATSQINS